MLRLLEYSVWENDYEVSCRFYPDSDFFHYIPGKASISTICDPHCSLAERDL